MYTFLRFPDFRRKVVTLSYDDGVTTDKRLVEILDRYGLKGTFNINSEIPPTGRRMSMEEVKELFLHSRHEVAVHGAKHF